MQEPIKVFYSHSKEDKKYLDFLKTHVANWNDNDLIFGWSDDDISAGDKWNEEIEDALKNSEIVIFLTSYTSLASKYIKEKEIQLTLARPKGEVVIFPVLVTDCAWETTSLFDLQGRPKIKGKLTPLDKLDPSQLQTELKTIAEAIRKSAQDICSRKGDMQRNDGKLSENEKLYSSCLSFPDCSNNFYGREIELNLLENQVQESRVVVMYGEPGVGKTDLASQLAKRLSKDYEIFWLDVKGGEKLSLEELFLHIGEFLKAHGEQGFVTTYAKEKEAGINITPKNKVDTLVTLLGEISKKSKYLFFLDNFQRTDHSEVNYFIERFLLYGNKSRLVLIDRFPIKSLGGSLLGKVQKFSVNGFEPDDANQYVQKLCQDYTVQWTNQAIRQIYQKTDGHPQAITLIVIWAHTQGDSLKNVVDNLVDFDKQDGSTLSQKLLQDVAKDLEVEEREVLQYLSLFRTSFHRNIQVYSNIPNNVWRSLVQYRWIKSEGCDNFRMHSLIAEFWRSSASESANIKQWHEKIANYYWIQGRENSVEFVDRDCYLESHYHWIKINKVKEAAQVLNELINHIHSKERLPSERLPGLSSWLLKLDKSIIQDFPWLLLEKGRKFEKTTNFNEAKKCFENAYKVFNSQKNTLGSSVSLYYIGKMLYLIPDYQRTLETLEEVLGIVENDNLMQIRTLGKIVKCYLHLDQVEEAADYANKAKQLAIECGDELGLALILYHQGSIYRRQSDFQKAEKYYYESAKLFKKLGEVYRQSKSLARLGRCQQFQTKYKEAEENLKEAIKLKTDINDLHGLARDNDDLADIYNRLGEYSKARECYFASIKIKKGNADVKEDVYGVIKSYNNLTNLALATNHCKEAQKYITEAKKLINQQTEIFINLEGTRLRLQGDLQFIQGDYESALQSCQNALTCFVSPNPVVLHSQALIFLSLGRIYTMLGEFALAQGNLESAYAIFEKSQMIDHKIRASTYLFRLSSFFNPDDAYKKNQALLDIAEKKGVKSILIICLETHATITEKRLLEKSFDNFQGIFEEEKTQQQKYLIDQVYNYYDKIIDFRRKTDLANEDIKGIAHFKVKKYLWLFAVKYFCGTPPSSDEAYQILSSEQFAKDLFEIELINFKFQLENVSAINSKIADKVSRFSLDMLAPIAMRFGFNNLREIIEDKALAFLYPEDYSGIQKWLTKNYPHREELIQEIRSELEDALEEAGISAEILPRIKTVYSIYKKSKERRVPRDKIIDVLGFRVVTKNKTDCYQILKIIQDMGQFFEGKDILKEPLRDYIKNPKKTTGYQSIHINICYGQPEAQIVEFQIRTDGMQLAAEYGGISILGLDKVSHARYKSENFYGRASSKKNYELDNRVRIKILIECTKNIILNVGRIIQESKFDIFGMDDIFQSSDDRVTMKLELVAKGTRLSKNPQDQELAIQELQDKLDEINAIQNGCIATKTLRNDVENNDFQKISLSLEEKTLLIQELTHYWSGENSYIYVITPKGDIKKISKPNLIKDNNEQKPQEISCIDFAYAIHEEVGNHCYAAKVNNEIVKLNTSIGNGDVVEIITRKNVSPNPTWLSFAATNSARNKIRRALKNINREKNIIKGREFLYKEIQKKEHGVNKQEIDRFLKSELMDDILKLCNYSSLDTLLAAIGNKDISKENIANKILEYRKTQIGKEDGTSIEDEISVKSKTSSKHSALTKSLFNEIEGILYNFAGCCDPLPGNPIVGIIPSRYIEGHNRGIVIHCQSCNHWQNVPKERQISLTWNEKTLPVKIRMKMMDRRDLLHDVLSHVKKMKVNVRNNEVIKYDSDNTATITLILDMSTSEELECILRKIKSMEDCISAYRVND